MSRLSTAVVVDDDARVSKAVAFGFEREGLAVETASNAEEGVQKAGSTKANVLVVSVEGAAGCDIVKVIRARADDLAKIPILVCGSRSTRKAALQAGANEFCIRPVFVKDIVHLAKLVCMAKPSGTAWSGDIGDFPGMFFLLRAISASGRSAVLTFVRGLRRGEVRFYEGEVTSAQAGTLHGIAALHQLLLWTEGRFELRAEDVVRRQQIPLSPQELFEDAQRFLNDFEEVARDLVPAAVYEQDLRRVAECVDKIPKEVNPVMRLFDGSRSLADVVEDSPFRVVETVKIAARLIELGALRKISAPRPRSNAHAALAVSEDWVIGTPPAAPEKVSGRKLTPLPIAVERPKPEPPKPEPPKPEPVVELTTPKPEPKPEKPKPEKQRHEKPKKKDKSGPIVTGTPMAAASSSGAATVAVTPAPAPVAPAPQSLPPVPETALAGATPSDDWTIPTPLASASDLAAFAPVVPSQAASGEIKIPSEAEIAAALATEPPANVADAVSASQPLEQVLAAMAGLTPPPDGPARPVNGDAGKAAPPIAASSAPPVPNAVPAPVKDSPSGGVARHAKGSTFSDVEEEFFRQEHKFENAKPAPVESFDDLDEGFEAPPPNFWKRLFGAKEPPAKGRKAAAQSRPSTVTGGAQHPPSPPTAKPVSPNSPKPRPGGGGHKKKRK